MDLGPDYRVVRELGRGSAGVVLEVRDAAGRALAVKVLLQGRGGEGPRFERERRLQGQLGEAEGFVPLLGWGEAPAGPFAVMPLLAGGTLRARLAAGPLSVEQAAALGASVGRALGAAHARGIVHRDLKPENVMFTAEGRPLVGDLGLAKHFRKDAAGGSQSVHLSGTGDQRGTAGYCAPEQVVDASRAVPQSDVFALGAIVYECLTGAPAFRGESVLELLVALSKGRIRPVRELRPEVPQAIAAVVERALAVDPASRQTDGLAFALALEAAARVERGMARGRPPGRGSGAVAFAAGAIVLLGAGAAAAIAWRASDDPPPETATDAPVATAPPAAAPRDEAAALDDRGCELTALGKLAEAVAEFDRAIAIDPLRASAYYNRGVARRELGERTEAARDFGRAAELDPRNAHAWLNRGTLRERAGDQQGALEDYDRAIDARPEDPLAWNNRGVLRRNMGDLKGAMEDLDRAVALAPPTLAEPWLNRGITFQTLGDHAAATRDLGRATAIVSNSAAAWEHLAVSQDALGDLQGSLASRTRSLDLDPSRAQVWWNRAATRHSLRDLQGALDDYTRALEVDPNVPHAHSNRGNVKGAMGDEPGALEDWGRAIELDPTDYMAFTNRASARARGGDDEGALADLEKALAHVPQGSQHEPLIRAELEKARKRLGR